ncbi:MULTISPECIES: o-succinylbenzoate synthase [unclassified Nodularia (in: cyanobacteria)]|uniref:o-succinylbenzoate synthase n=1 Tax=unclassified Nodularia (in: cyanobacteria) TaxID=2656917 RepID=UPI00188278A9|nr:o-succinylbenzoate synthase [Nodularia sp. LEGE 06071]MBE9201981.1 o-succinylbenzoate synthase [Nodularia sp. LEGE 06071]MCC2693848.1 o-succinylbenzoate synthase [Nodularia sp. LEGE 04288]
MRGYQFDFRCYRRRFLQPLVTNHGLWHTREGIIVCLGNCGYGEIAPISWFGSETLEQALNFCRQLPAEVTEEMIFSIPDSLPACQFGFESALGGMGSGEDKKYTQFLTYSGLLPSGEAALSEWERLWKEGYRTFKWKIGVNAISQELEIFDLLTRTLPPAAKLRLDANGGLSYEEAKRWLGICDDISANIEFLEQPLPVEQFSEMLELSAGFRTAIALDESVATLKQLEECWQQGWRGIFVIKPGIAGSPSRLRQFCQQHQIDAVFSSVFETEIGRQAALQLAAELSLTNRAVGFGINHFLEPAEKPEFKCP